MPAVTIGWLASWASTSDCRPIITAIITTLGTATAACWTIITAWAVTAATRALRWATSTTRCATTGFKIGYRCAIKFKQLNTRPNGGNNGAKLIPLIWRTK